MKRQQKSLSVKYKPLTKAVWKDFELLFGERGACGGCWCMWWRLKRSEFEKQKGDGNKKRMRKIVNSGEVPGIIAYDKNTPIGWCSISPRENFSALERSRILKPIDDKEVWSIVCFFVDKNYRRKGVSIQLLKAAIQYAAENGAQIVEGYPVEPNKDMPDVFAYTGLAAAYWKAGFKEAARRSPTRPVMRYAIKK